VEELNPPHPVEGVKSLGIIQKALADTLVAVESKKDLAFSTDFPANA